MEKGNTVQRTVLKSMQTMVLKMALSTLNLRVTILGSNKNLRRLVVKLFWFLIKMKVNLRRKDQRSWLKPRETSWGWFIGILDILTSQFWFGCSNKQEQKKSLFQLHKNWSAKCARKCTKKTGFASNTTRAQTKMGYHLCWHFLVEAPQKREEWRRKAHGGNLFSRCHGLACSLFCSRRQKDVHERHGPGVQEKTFENVVESFPQTKKSCIVTRRVVFGIRGWYNGWKTTWFSHLLLREKLIGRLENTQDIFILSKIKWRNLLRSLRMMWVPRTS